MNGATAVPCTSTKRPPSSAMIKKIGSSQNFLRARIKSQSSRRVDMKETPKIVF